MRQVWKYTLMFADDTFQTMPEGAEILHVGNQDGRLCVWALVDPSRPQVRRSFLVAGTGHMLADDGLKYLGSAIFKGGNLVFHVFEKI